MRNERGGAARNKALLGLASPKAEVDPKAPPPAPRRFPAAGPILPAFIVPLPDRFSQLRPGRAGRPPPGFRAPWVGHAHWGCKEEAHTLLHPDKL